ncbi:MAG: sulfate ABC transporter substrate-binding protein [Burkholderiales bacterium]|nr:sulfate ABC transporter substrate-binding protein [Phycisphaerae bacterium]
MNIWKPIAAAALAIPLLAASFAGAEIQLLNVSYDASRELYTEIDAAFADDYKAKTGTAVSVSQSHGGSAKQARAVVDGLKADIIAPALAHDITSIENAGLINAGWQSRLPYNSSPYTSTIIFLVRKGNPKGIKDWNDIVKPGVQALAPNPKTGGGSRWIFLAAWGYAASAPARDLASAEALNESLAAAKNATTFPAYDDAKAKEFVTALYKNIPILDTGARGSAVSFAQKNIGDVLITWENEAWLAQEEYGKDKFEIVYPSVSILAEPPVAIVDKNVDERSTRAAAEAFVNFLYTPKAQDIIAENYYRPRDPAIAKKHAEILPPIKLFTIDEVFGGWPKAQTAFFTDGAVFDQIYQAKK